MWIFNPFFLPFSLTAKMGQTGRSIGLLPLVIAEEVGLCYVAGFAFVVDSELGNFRVD